MTKAELIKKLSKRLKITIKDSNVLYHSLTDEITAILSSGDSIHIPGFGNFSVHKLEKRKGFNPLIEKWMMLPPKLKPHFKPSDSVKKMVNN